MHGRHSVQDPLFVFVIGRIRKGIGNLHGSAVFWDAHVPLRKILHCHVDVALIIAFLFSYIAALVIGYLRRTGDGKSCAEISRELCESPCFSNAEDVDIVVRLHPLLEKHLPHGEVLFTGALRDCELFAGVVVGHHKHRNIACLAQVHAVPHQHEVVLAIWEFHVECVPFVRLTVPNGAVDEEVVVGLAGFGTASETFVHLWAEAGEVD